MYRAITRSIQVRVEPKYLHERSAPDEDRFFWAYTIEISNLGNEQVQLLRRHWKIVDAQGRMEEVRGVGVVGEQPELMPGQSFEYTSGVPLSTPSGFMSGSYQMQSSTGERFDVEVPAFALDLPDTKKPLN